MKKIIKAVSFVIICFVCLTVVSKILEYKHEMEPELAVKEFYSLEEDTIQMLVIGSSHTTMAFSPIECYKQTQITSYNLSTPKQPIELTYYMLEEALKTQSPKVVMYEVANLFYDEDDINIAKFRHNMDSMPLSLTKIKLARCYANYNSDMKLYSMAEALCPIYYYHDRWKEINEDSFDINAKTSYLKGQVIRTCIKEISYDLEKFDLNLAKEIELDPEAAPVISDNNMSYFLKMKKLCEENNIKLFLTSTPSNRWNSTMKEMVEQICKENKLDFADLNLPDGELIDFSTDMADGNHVNAAGAKKTTKYLYDYVIENYGLTGSVCDEFEESIKYYDKYYDNIAKYSMETDFNEYLSLLNENKKDLAIFICGNGEMFEGMQDEDIKLLQELGCEITFDDSYNGYSYISVIDEGNVLYESADKGAVSYKYKLENGSKVKLSSKGSFAGKEAAIKINIDDYVLNGDGDIIDDYEINNLGIDEDEYAINSEGINIVVYDKESNLVMDSVAFNTHSIDRKWYRGDNRNLELSLYKSYKKWVLENY